MSQQTRRGQPLLQPNGPTCPLTEVRHPARAPDPRDPLQSPQNLRVALPPDLGGDLPSCCQTTAEVRPWAGQRQPCHTGPHCVTPLCPCESSPKNNPLALKTWSSHLHIHPTTFCSLLLALDVAVEFRLREYFFPRKNWNKFCHGGSPHPWQCSKTMDVTLGDRLGGDWAKG